MIVDRKERNRRAFVRRVIEDYLYTTAWGKYFARPSQIRAAAKKLERARKLPAPVADLFKLKAA